MIQTVDEISTFTKPIPFHICYDACSRLCQCDDCSDTLVIAADEEFTVVQALLTSEAPLSKVQQLQLCETIN